MASCLSETTHSLQRALLPFTSGYLWAKLMGRPASSEEDIFPSKELAVELWKTNLARLPLLKDEPDLVSLLDTRDTTVVTQLFLCKHKGVSKHEYLVAQLRRKDGRVVHARIERYRGDPNVERQELERQKQKNARDRASHHRDTSDPSLRLSSSSYGSQLTARARDTVRCTIPCFGRVFKMKNVVKVYKFNPEHQPTIVDLAIAAFVAHEHDVIYSLLLHQCYWYADVVCAILENIVGKDHYSEFTRKQNRILTEVDAFLSYDDLRALDPSLAQQQQNERVKAFIPLDDIEWSNLEQGCNVVKISTRQPNVVESLLRDFMKVKEKFKEKDNFAKMDPVEQQKATEQLQATQAQLQATQAQLQAAQAQVQTTQAQLQAAKAQLLARESQEASGSTCRTSV